MPNDIYFNEVENQQKTIFQKIDGFLDNPYTATAKQRFSKQVKTNSIESLVAVNAYPIANANKNITIKISGRVVTLSASAFNSLRVSPSSNYAIGQFNAGLPDTGIIEQINVAQQVVTFFSNYSGNNVCLGFFNPSFASTVDYPVNLIIENLTIGTITSGSFQNPFPLATGFEYRFLFNVGAGEIKITAVAPAFPRVLNATRTNVYVRRCKYPILEDDPVKVYDPRFVEIPGGGGGVFIDYGQTTKRKITLSDIDNFRIG